MATSLSQFRCHELCSPEPAIELRVLTRKTWGTRDDASSGRFQLFFAFLFHRSEGRVRIWGVVGAVETESNEAAGSFNQTRSDCGNTLLTSFSRGYPGT
jgi:hypothetical protein